MNEKNERSPFLMCEDYDAYLESMSKTELLEYFHFVMGNYQHLVDKVTRENIELQKQVNELKVYLTSEKVCSKQVKEENDKLRKQVEDRKKLYDLAKAFHDEKCAEFEKLCYDYNKLQEKYEQAVKDKAKEILEWLKSKVIMTEIPHGSEPCEEDVEAVMWWQIKEYFKEECGVEVE